MDALPPPQPFHRIGLSDAGNLPVLLSVIAVAHDNAEGPQFVAGIIGCP